MASKQIGALNVTLDLGVDTFLQNLKNAQKETDAYIKSFKPLTDVLKETGEAMSVFGDVIAAGLVEASLKTAEYGAQLQHLSEKSGASVEDLAKLGFAAEQNGSSIEGLGTSLKFLSKNMELAETGSKAQVTAFANLGITEKDLSATHGSASAAFKLLADRIKDMADPSTHAADLTKILGKNWTEILPTLLLGSDGLESLGDLAERLGIVLDGETTEADLKFEQSMKQAKTAIDGLYASIGSALIPILTPLTNDLTDGVVAAKDFTKAHQDLTVGVFGAASAIGGTGGLLLSISALGAVSRPFSAGLDLIKASIGSVGAEAATATDLSRQYGESIADVGNIIAKPSGILGVSAGLATALKAATSEGGLLAEGLVSVGIEAAGLGAGLVVLTTGALVGLAAGVGYVIGSFINWGLETTGLQKDFDSLFAEIVNVGIPVIGKYLTGSNALIDSSKLSSDVQGKLADVLTKAGISFDRAQLGNAAYVAGLGKQIQAANVGMVTQADFNAEIAKFQTAEENLAKAMAASAAEAKRHQEAVQSIVDSVIPTTHAENDLSDAVQRLTTAGIKQIDMLPQLGKKASDMAAEWVKAGKSVEEPVAELAKAYDNSQALIKATTNIKSYADAVNTANLGIAKVQSTAIDKETALIAGMASALAAASQGAENANTKFFDDMATTIAGYQKALDDVTTSQVDSSSKAQAKAIEDAEKAAKKAADQYEADVNNAISDITGHLSGEALTWGNITDTFFDNWHQWEANDLVQNFQHPFDVHLADIINGVTGELNSGQLQLNDAIYAQSEMHQLWTSVASAVDSWAVGSKDKEKVAGQFHATEDSFVGGWLNWIDSIVASQQAMPSFAVGINNVPFDMIAQIHKGEAVIPAAMNPANRVFGGSLGGQQAQASAPVTLQVNISIEAGARITAQEVRDVIVPELDLIVKNDSRGLATTITRKVKLGWNGLVTT